MMTVLSQSDQLRRELLRRRLPRFYVHRAVREFTDHGHDIAREGASAGDSAERMGDPQALAARMATEFRARHFAGRHPWLVFAFAPIPCTILAAALFCVVMMISIELLDPIISAVGPSGSHELFVSIACHAGVVVPLLGMSWWFGKLAYRSGCGARWSWTASLLMCLLGALTQFQLEFPTANTNGVFALGVSVPPAINWSFLMLPLLTAFGLAWHVTHRATPALAEE
jgi:hypothetical protein